MAVMAQWLSKQWEISPQKIVALENMSTSYKLQADTNSDAEGKPSTNVRGKELQPLSLETFLSDSVGVDVTPEIESWGSLVGQSDTFLLAGRRFGPDKLKLTKVDVSDVIIDDFGRIRQARLSLSFQEDAPEAAKSKSSSSATLSTLKTSPGIISEATYSELGINISAVSIGASSRDKVAKKPANPQLNTTIEVM